MLTHLLRVSDLSKLDLTRTIDLADAFKKQPDRSATLLRGSSVTIHFAKPSTRTRISFETAVHRLGGLPITVGSADLQMGHSETVEDTARVISRMSAAFVTRTFKDDDLVRFARAATIPVINALTDGHHPCQAVADLMTLRARFGRLEGLKLAYVGAGNNVAHSLLEACAIMGIHIRVATPNAFACDPAVVAFTRSLATETGAEVLVTDDPKEAADGADCIYTDTWLSMGDPPEERAARLAALGPYQVNPRLFARASERAIFMHCLPAHRGEEVTNDIADAANSVIFDQAENRLHTSLAILELALTGGFQGSRAKG